MISLYTFVVINQDGVIIFLRVTIQNPLEWLLLRNYNAAISCIFPIWPQYFTHGGRKTFIM